jgi:NAD(P)-dependent dehydrogenase (short-subunit alcohol dehydrogenase family)
MTSTASPTVLITGTSSGIGLATAIAAARAGFTTVATMRDPGRAAALRDAADAAGAELDVRRLDITDAASISACVEGVVETYGRLDGLVNNAGVANSDPTMEMSSMAALRANMEVNFFGVVAVSRVAMAHLRAARGRLVTIGSVHGVIAPPFNEAYSAAKFAIEGFMESLAPVAAEAGVTVSLVVPGPVRGTNFGIFPDVNRQTVLAASGPYAPTMRAFMEWQNHHFWADAQTPPEVAHAVVRALTDDHPPFRIVTSEWADEYLAAKLADRDGAAVQGRTRSWVSGATDPVTG